MSSRKNYVDAFESAYNVWQIMEDSHWFDVSLGHMDEFADNLGITRDYVYAAILAIEDAYNCVIETTNRNEVVVLQA